MDHPTRELHDAGVVADLFRVSRRTVNEWRRRGQIPFVRVSRGTVRFDIDEVLRARRVEPQSQGNRGGGGE